MAIIPAKCTQCGANIQVDETQEAGICQYCGTAFITEKAINNYNITNNVNIANATINVTGGDIENLLLRAQQYEDCGDYEKAKEYYNRILDIDANHEIAKTKVFKLGAFYIGAVEVSKQQLDTIEECIKKGEKLHAIRITREMSGLGLANAKHYVENFYNINKNKPQNYSQQTAPSLSTKSSGGCYVATCVYGSYDCSQVWTLRRYRDNILGSTWYGRCFIRTYYAISPTLVKWFGKTKWFKKFWRSKLDRMVAKLHAEGIENTPYKDRNW